MSQHVFSGSGAPATTPTAIGQHYIDTTGGMSYISVGTTSPADWSAGGGGSAITALTADVTASGPGSAAATVAFVGGSSAANVNTAEVAANAATSANTASTIVKRDALGDFGAGTITASLVGDVTGNASGTAANVTGVVAIANGGTNASTSLNNNRVIQSTAGSIVEAAAITAARALISDVNGIPTQSVTTSAELAFVSGATSSIQTQINGKQATGNYITALTGDVTASGPGSVAGTLATVNSNVGTFGSASSVAVVTENAKGLTTAAVDTPIQIAESQVTNLVSDLAAKQPTGNYITALTGDGTAAGPGSSALTLSTVNSDVGSFGSSTAIPSVTVNGKGLITAASTSPVIAPAGTLTGTTLASNVVSSSLASVGTITSGVWNGTTIALANGGTGQVTKAAAFDALSPMTTQYDLITGGASGTGTRLAKGADGTHLTTQSGVVAWTADPTPYVVSSINSNTSAATGNTYLCDTSGGAFNVTLPSPVTGAFIVIKDKLGTFGTNNLTVVRAGSEKIEGLAASKVLQTNWGAFSIFSDGTDWFMGPF